MRIASRLTLLAVAGGITLLSGFFVYGWSKGYDPIRGLGNILRPHAEVVESNPKTTRIAEHRVSWLGDIEHRDLKESSGLAASIKHPGVLWSMNDSGGDAELFAMTEGGAHLARLSVASRKPTDWESLDTFEFDGETYIAIGDIGDNFGWRKDVSVLVVPEPITIADARLEPAWEITYTYPDGARDSEALAVDVEGRRILVLSKRDYPPSLYSVPLMVTEPAVALKMGELSHLPQPMQSDYDEEPKGAQYRYMPSGMDYDPITGRLLITTYKDAYIYDLANLRSTPLWIPMPRIGQREAITWVGSAGDRAVVSRERFEQQGAAQLFEIVLITP
jgi:hypothetical protein